MKKLIAIIMACVILFTFIACGSSSSDDMSLATTEAATASSISSADRKDAAPADAPEPAPVEAPAAEAAAEAEEAIYDGGVEAMYGMADADGMPDPDTMPYEPVEPAASFVLTAAEWNDNENWPFFINLVNSQIISFPAYGIDPVQRTKVNVTDPSGNVIANVKVELMNGDSVVWTAMSGSDGVAYLFGDGDTVRIEESPDSILLVDLTSGVTEDLPEDADPQQGGGFSSASDEIMITTSAPGENHNNTQVMFILDTTGSMSDEIAYLQKDFSSIASDVGADGISWSVNFYRDEGDEYVTRCNPFTDNIQDVQEKINAEYADGGGDTPEAIAEILSETITYNEEWSDSANKIAFLIFDAPPHDGREQELQAAVESAASRGIKLIPVVASNADRETELFGRAIAICTNGTYVFLTDDSGVGNSHLEPIVGDYTVELLHDIIVRVITENMVY